MQPGWSIYQDTEIVNMNSFDCNDTVTGNCEQMSLYDCVELCKDSGECNLGYHINPGNICVPINTSIYGNINPAYLIRKKGTYPELNNFDISTFLNETKYQYPPNDANVVYYRDVLYLKLYDLDMGLSNSDAIVVFTEKPDLLQFIPKKHINPSIDHILQMNYGDEFSINMVSTTLLLTKNFESGNFFFDNTYDMNIQTDKLFSFHSPEKADGERMVYGDVFYITYITTDILYLNRNNVLVSKYDTYEKAKWLMNSHLFILEPRMAGYYSNDCKEVELVNCKKNNQQLEYMGHPVYRVNYCRNNIKPSPGKPSKYIFYTVGIIATILLAVIIVLLFRRQK